MRMQEVEIALIFRINPDQFSQLEWTKVRMCLLSTDMVVECSYVQLVEKPEFVFFWHPKLVYFL